MLLQNRDHPTAAELFLRAKKRMASISLATIYNCLEALIDSSLVKQRGSVNQLMFGLSATYRFDFSL